MDIRDDYRIGLSTIKLLSTRRYDSINQVDLNYIDSTLRDICLLRDNDDNNGDKVVVDNSIIEVAETTGNNDQKDNKKHDILHADPHHGNMVEDNNNDNNNHNNNNNHEIEDINDISVSSPVSSIPFVFTIQYSDTQHINSAIEAFLRDNYHAKQNSNDNNTNTVDNKDNDYNNVVGSNKSPSIDNLNDYNITSHIECTHCNSIEIMHMKKLSELSSWRKSLMNNILDNNH